jgi:hypothetical protein
MFNLKVRHPRCVFESNVKGYVLPHLHTRVYNLLISLFIYNLMMAKTYGRNM